MRYVRFPGGAVGEIPDPPEPRPSKRIYCDACEGTGNGAIHGVDGTCSEEPPATVVPFGAVWKLADPPASPEPPELKEALDEYERTSIGVGKAESIPNLATSLDWVRGNAAAARAALVAIYDRQEEALEMFREEQSRDKAQVASLSSQLEHQRRDTERVMDLAIEYQSQLERLTAEQMTAEEAQHAQSFGGHPH